VAMMFDHCAWFWIYFDCSSPLRDTLCLIFDYLKCCAAIYPKSAITNITSIK
jgi:hypothetical protein